MSDYVPFYFTPFSMMMYNITTGYGGIRQFPNSEIVIMVSSLRGLVDRGVAVVFSDRHAYLQTAQFYTSLEDLVRIDWGILQRKDFKKDPDDLEKTDRYQAEALVHRQLPAEHLLGIVCLSGREKQVLEQQRKQIGLDLRITAQPNWYFK